MPKNNKKDNSTKSKDFETKSKSTSRRNGSKRNRKSNDQSGSERNGSGNMANAVSVNNLSWYTKYPSVIEAAAKFPYPYRPGMAVPFGRTTSTIEATTVPALRASDISYEIPGVMVLDWVPTVGKSERATDPASVVAKELYSKVRSKYSGSLDADAPDFMTYIMAMDSIFAYIAYLKRIYRTISAFDPENYATPYQVLRAMGLSSVTIENLRNNKTRLYGLINELILQSRKFTVPVGMDIFNRHYWMSDNVYKDSDSPRSQYYLFNVKALYKYEFDTVTERPILRLYNLPQFGAKHLINDVTVTEFFEYGIDMIDRLVAWDDAYTINGYLMRAFEGTDGFIVSEMAADEVINYLPVPEVLMQIENSHTIPYGTALNFNSNNETFAISQDVSTNSVVSSLSYDISADDPYLRDLDVDILIAAGLVSLAPVLNIRSDNPEAGSNILASRLQAHTVVSRVDDKYHFEVTCGTEVPLAWRYVEAEMDGDQVMKSALDSQEIVTFEAMSTSVNIEASIQIQALSDLRKVLRMEAFAFHPMVRVSNLRLSSTYGIFSGTYLCVDVSNLTTITRDALKELHKCCLYSELNAFSI